MIDFLKRLWQWATKYKYVFFIFLIVVPFLAIWIMNFSIPKVKILNIYGWALETWGTIFVIKSFAQKLKLFNEGGYPEAIKKMRDEFPSFKPKKDNVVIQPGTGSVIYTGHNVRISIKPPETDIAATIKFFHKQIDEIYEAISKAKGESKEHTDKLRDVVLQHKQENIKQHEETRALITEATKPDLWRDTFSVWCILLGMFLSTFSEIIFN